MELDALFGSLIRTQERLLVKVQITETGATHVLEMLVPRTVTKTSSRCRVVLNKY